MSSGKNTIMEMVKNVNTKLYTLIIVKNKDNKTLLGYKKRGFATGTWNGFGGKVEPGENILNSAKRELQEECGLEAKSLRKLGILYFKNHAWTPQLHEVHLFVTNEGEYEGDVIESEEMKPRWFKLDELPYEQMLPPNKYWLPKALEEQIFDAFFVLNGNENELVSYKVDDH